LSVAIAKRILWEAQTKSVAETRGIEDRLFGWVARQPDAQEGIAAFVEKREPKWSLRVSTDMPDWPQ
jgi:enoyl-CoA hydratase/carnithine racemase